MTKEEILGILKLDEAGQVKWLKENSVLKKVDITFMECDSYGISIDNFYDESACVTHDESLADAAFRLRDEVCREFGDSYFVQAIMTVCSFAVPSIDKWNMQAKPIHWIVAALLVKIETEHP